MPLDNSEIRLLRGSFDDLKPELDDASVAFYERFFELAPELRSLFRTDIEDQGMRFMSAVGTILDRLDRPEGADETMRHLGEGHAAVGVKPEHFRPMRTALVDTFRQTLGPRFTQAHAAAWGKAFDEIAAGMVAAGQAAGMPPNPPDHRAAGAGPARSQPPGGR